MQLRSLVVTTLAAFLSACGTGCGSSEVNPTNDDNMLEAECSETDRCSVGYACVSGQCVVDDGDGDASGSDPSDTDGSDPAPGDDTTGGDTGGDPVTPPPPQHLRFVAIGDTGKGNDTQKNVANSIAAVCAVEGCDFMLLLGDNIYPSGVSSVDDPQWQEKFELPYSVLDFPIWGVLGNHDYGGDGLGNEEWKGQIQVDYAAISPKLEMKGAFYTFTAKNVGFVVLDTNSILYDKGGPQRDWYPGAAQGLNTEWRIVLGHHPYRSNGKHGNAGNYDDVPPYGALEVPAGVHVKEFMDDVVCGTNDVYLSGHDHSLQWLQETLCGAELVVSGGGASFTAIEGHGNQAFWENAEAGFFYVDIVGKTFKGRFYAEDGTLRYERTFTKP